MSKNNPFGITEAAALFLSMAVETALRRAMRQIEGLSDEEIKPLIAQEEERKQKLMEQIRRH